MSRAQLVTKLLKVDPNLAIQLLRNEKLAAKMKVDSLLKELHLHVQQNGKV